MDLPAAEPFLRDHHKAVLVTLLEGEVPHATNVMYAFDGERFRISLTDGRVKTDNLRRRPLAVLTASSEDFWQYVTAECDAELSAVSSTPGDDVGRELLEIYQQMSGAHPDPDEFLQAMVDDHRLVLRLTPARVYGQLR